MIHVEPQVILTNATAYSSSHTMSDVEALSFPHMLTHARTHNAHLHVHTHTHMSSYVDETS